MSFLHGVKIVLRVLVWSFALIVGAWIMTVIYAAIILVK